MFKNRYHLYLGFIAVFCLLHCNLDSHDRSDVKAPDPSDRGYQLAQQYCSRCHSFPSADILPTTYWGRLMPIMGFFLGAGKEKYEFADYLHPIARERLSQSGLFPETPIINVDDWIAINKYYLHYSPREIFVEETSPFDMNLSQFAVEKLPWKGSGEGLSYLGFKEGHYEIGFYDQDDSYFLRLDSAGTEIERTKVASPVSDILSREDETLLLLLGKLDNIDVPTGSIVSKTQQLNEVIAPLERPTHFEIEDFNQDGIQDLLVAEFGKFLGGVNMYSSKDPAKKINIHPHPGAVKIILRDVNEDGLMDFYVLVTQEDESIYLFLNTGDFKFDKKRLIRLPAHYGTTHFELLDFDGDGDEDIICCSGDSGDYGIIAKPFHGVRIFENNGNDEYREVWFFPQQGAYGTTAADFDQDGDLDFASIGYFAAHLGRDRELFIYFENRMDEENGWNFVPHGFHGQEGDCWMLINNADVDGDGDQDILLGANAKVLKDEQKGNKSLQWQNEGGMVTILRNNLIE